MRLSSLLIVGMFAATAAAHATSITYGIQGYINTDPTKAITVTGTTTLDLYISNPSVLSITLKFSDGTTQTGIGSGGQDHSHFVYVGAANDLFSFTDDLHNYTLAGGTFNLKDQSLNYVGGVFNGTLTPLPPPPVPPTALTPEPSSLILLGSGLLGMVGVVRRRVVQGCFKR